MEIIILYTLTVGNLLIVCNVAFNIFLYNIVILELNEMYCGYLCSSTKYSLFSEVYDRRFEQWKLTLPENVAIDWE